MPVLLNHGISSLKISRTSFSSGFPLLLATSASNAFFFHHSLRWMWSCSSLCEVSGSSSAGPSAASSRRSHSLAEGSGLPFGFGFSCVPPVKRSSFTIASALTERTTRNRAMRGIFMVVGFSSAWTQPRLPDDRSDCSGSDE